MDTTIPSGWECSVFATINQPAHHSEAKEVSRYSLDGQRLTAPVKGLNIVRYSDGTIKKEAVH